MTFNERLDEIERKIKEPSFRENKGLGNEVGYYIFDYPPEKEFEVRNKVEFLRKKNENSPDGFKVAVFDLYEMIVDILKDKGFLDKCFQMEEKYGIERLVKSVGNTLRLTQEDNLIVNRIKDGTPDNCVVFLTGIGKCYPLLRSHTVLNNLHQVLDKVPVVLFYPGKYDGQRLELFGELKDDNYYRAFKLVD